MSVTNKERQIIKARHGTFSYYSTEAQGRPVIFVHGWCCAPQFFDATLRNLPSGFKGYALDIFDKQCAKGGDFSIDGLAAAIADFARSLERGNPIVVGHSFGGVVAQKIGIAHGEVFDRIVLCGTGASLKGYNLRMTEILDRLREEGNSEAFVRTLMEKFFYALPPAPVFDGFVQHVVGVDRAAMQAAMISLMATDLESEVHRIDVPVLHIHGDQDRGRTMDHVRFLETNIPGIRVEIFEQTGHAMMVERPERFQKTLNEFLIETRA